MLTVNLFYFSIGKIFFSWTNMGSSALVPKMIPRCLDMLGQQLGWKYL